MVFVRYCFGCLLNWLVLIRRFGDGVLFCYVCYFGCYVCFWLTFITLLCCYRSMTIWFTFWSICFCGGFVALIFTLVLV